MGQVPGCDGRGGQRRGPAAVDAPNEYAPGYHVVLDAGQVVTVRWDHVTVSPPALLNQQQVNRLLRGLRREEILNLCTGGHLLYEQSHLGKSIFNGSEEDGLGSAVFPPV